MKKSSAQIKKPAPQIIQDRHSDIQYYRDNNAGQENYQPPRLTPEVLVETFGSDIEPIVTRNLKLACDRWQEKHRWIQDVEHIIPRLPKADNEITLRGLYEAMLPRAKRELTQIERHIRHLQRCFDLLRGTQIFAPKQYQHHVDVAALKERADISDIIGRQVELRQHGNRFTGRCPFHNDRSPSFVVFADTQSWWCFACSEGGDVISFIQKLHSCDFKQAINELQQL